MAVFELTDLLLGERFNRRFSNSLSSDFSVNKQTHDLPRQRAPCLIFCHAGLEEVLLLAKVNRLAHPRERIFGAEFRRQANTFQAAVGNMLDVFAEQPPIEAKNATRQTILRVGTLEFHSFLDQCL